MQALKPVYHFMGSRVETRRFQSLWVNQFITSWAQGLKPDAFNRYGSTGFNSGTTPPHEQEHDRRGVLRHVGRRLRPLVHHRGAET
jgi:hypothetical protein